MNLDENLRTMLRERTEDVAAAPVVPDSTVRRVRGHKTLMIGSMAAAVAALVVGGFAAAQALSNDDPPAPPANEKKQETTESSGGMWPQSTLVEVERAQRLADEGDPRYTWQVFRDWPPYPEMEPAEADIFVRFVEEKLGWEEFSWGVGPSLYPPEDWPWQFVVVRCAQNETNSMYPNDPDGQRCAPTLNENRYETVRISGDMPMRTDDPSGIWVVSEWRMLEPSASSVTSIDGFYQHQIQQVEPPSDAETTDLLTDFLQARVDGEGAEEYVQAPPERQIPLMYATSSNAPFERFEVEL